MIALGIILYIAVGFGLGYCFLWVRDKFMIMDIRLDTLEAPRKLTTDAQGNECDPDNEEVRGYIGYMESK
jgi:hypothetical protein